MTFHRSGETFFPLRSMVVSVFEIQILYLPVKGISVERRSFSKNKTHRVPYHFLKVPGVKTQDFRYDVVTRFCSFSLELLKSSVCGFQMRLKT